MRRLWALLPLLLLAPAGARADVVGDVRGAIAEQRFDEARRRVSEARAGGDSPAAQEALSWLARGELAARQLDAALGDAKATRAAALALLKSRPLDAEPRLPIALGAAIEVEAQATAQKGERAAAVAQLERDLKQYDKTSLALRIQKNLNLLTLEGKTAPPLEREPHFGAAVPSLASLRGKPVLLFFWAHWCPDCKAMAPLIGKLRDELSPRGLVVLAPTQLYGAVGGGEEAPPNVEMGWIDEVRKQRYAALGDAPVPVSAANFRSYGASSVPTIVLIDRQGKVVFYHPSKLSADELVPRVRALLR